MRTIGRPELKDDPRFRTKSDRVHHMAELAAIIGEFCPRRTEVVNKVREHIQGADAMCSAGTR